MTFQEEKLQEFYSLFNTVQSKIAGFHGCSSLKLFSDIADKTVIFTYSEWSSEQDLNFYRNSELFKETWAKTKKLFKAAPEAWSVKNAF